MAGRMKTTTHRFAAIFTIPLLFASEVSAHEVVLTNVVVRFDAGGGFEIDFHYDVDAWVLSARPEHLSAFDRQRITTMPADEQAPRLRELREHILRNVRVRFDDQKFAPDMSVVENPEKRAGAHGGGPAMARIVRLSGSVPGGAKAFDFWASRSFGYISIIIQRAGQEGIERQLLERADRSKPYSLVNAAKSTTALQSLRQYIVLGFEHIIPEGLDHVLFVLGLFLLSNKLGPLLWQVTAFTVAHSVSLALSMYGVVSLSPRVVEPLIALSIALVAIENVTTSKLHSWRPIVVFGFGLLHGLGFAGVLTDLGLPPNQFVAALVGFNLGVELGQIAVILIALCVVGWFRSRVWYRRWITIPASLAIAAVGLYWTVERVTG
jgi:hypothetical protein